MTETLNTIITLSSGKHFFLQSVSNATEPQSGEPVASSGNYYVGYRCAANSGDADAIADDSLPFSGHQPGQVYPTDTIASQENAPTDIML